MQPHPGQSNREGENRTRTIQACLTMASLLLAAEYPGSALAVDGPQQNGGSTGAAMASDEALNTVVVTGSYIRRTDTETPSPLQVISAADIDKSGSVSISDVIRKVSADNSGSLTQNFSGALAGGASGISLRGLTLDATLVLVDGHRMAPYPLADDGQRPFVDLSSLPMSIVDRVEVLKDGASAIYGSDAIAGVVNVILKHEFQGLQLDADFGSSYRGDGLTQRASALWGFGDLAADGHNFYLQSRISASGFDQSTGPRLVPQRPGPDPLRRAGSPRRRRATGVPEQRHVHSARNGSAPILGPGLRS